MEIGDFGHIEFWNESFGNNTEKWLQDEENSITERPSMYQVVILEDDDTPVEYIMYVLERFFHRSPEDIAKTLSDIGDHGHGVCGVYTKEVAETKMAHIVSLSKEYDHPLKCVIRKSK